MVRSVYNDIRDITEGARHETGVELTMNTISNVGAANLRYNHPLVKSAGEIIGRLGLKPVSAHSESELSIFLSRKIPAVTLGVTRGENHHLENATIEIAPMFQGSPRSWRQFWPSTAGLAMTRWLENNTFHYARFQNLDRLVAAKKERDLTISLCLPTLNEEKTIAKEIVIMRSELMQRHRLIDEIVVVDSGSTDRTLEVAAAYGADVYRADDILPGLEKFKGKGENLWKALYITRGDIIVYLDADIKNIHHRFAYGLIGPLLTDRRIKYTKGFYDAAHRHRQKTAFGPPAAAG